MSKNLAINVESLKKSYGDLQVLNNVSFRLEKGQVLALLGPNGAGKTTTVKILATLLKADSGLVEVEGYDVKKDADKVREAIGLTGQFAAVDEYLTATENVEMIGKLHHMPRKVVERRTKHLIRQFDLVDAANRPARTYSGGMKRRLDLAMSLVAEPKVLFLDEPTTGLDPRSRITLWEIVQNLADSGVSVLLTTQHMEEAEYLADNVIVLDEGKVIAEGTVNQLKARAGSERIEITLKNTDLIADALTLLGQKARHTKSTDTITIPAKNGVASLQDTIKVLTAKSIEIDAIGLRRPTLDDVFLALTGHKAESKSSGKDKKS